MNGRPMLAEVSRNAARNMLCLWLNVGGVIVALATTGGA